MAKKVMYRKQLTICALESKVKLLTCRLETVTANVSGAEVASGNDVREITEQLAQAKKQIDILSSMVAGKQVSKDQVGDITEFLVTGYSIL
jgi:hypothetical protein